MTGFVVCQLELGKTRNRVASLAVLIRRTTRNPQLSGRDLLICLRKYLAKIRAAPAAEADIDGAWTACIRDPAEIYRSPLSMHAVHAPPSTQSLPPPSIACPSVSDDAPRPFRGLL